MRVPLSLLPLAFATACLAQSQISLPLGDTLNKALHTSVLTETGSHPFHVKMHVRSVLDPASPIQADIEEYWASPTLWKRTVTAPGLQQITTVNDSGTYFETTGDYYPEWLRRYVTALLDPVPESAQWNQPDARMQQTVLPNGNKSPRCLNRATRFGENSFALAASICFYDNGLLASTEKFGGRIEFNEFNAFHGHQIAYLYLSRASDGQLLAGKIEKLEDSNKKDSFFATPSAGTKADPLATFTLPESQLLRMAGGSIPIDWPAVRSKTVGVLTAFVSIDRSGRIREMTTSPNDDPALSKAVYQQLLDKQWKPAVSQKLPIQVEGAISLPFSLPASTSTADALSSSKEFSVSIDKAVVAGRKIGGANPIYPRIAKERDMTGSVYLSALIDKTGSISQIGVIDSVDPVLSTAAIEAVKTWKYQPYLLNGEPTAVDSIITVNFNIAH